MFETFLEFGIVIQPLKKSESTRTVLFSLSRTVPIETHSSKASRHGLLDASIICGALSLLPLIPCSLNPVCQVPLSESPSCSQARHPGVGSLIFQNCLMEPKLLCECVPGDVSVARFMSFLYTRERTEIRLCGCLESASVPAAVPGRWASSTRPLSVIAGSATRHRCTQHRGASPLQEPLFVTLVLSWDARSHTDVSAPGEGRGREGAA